MLFVPGESFLSAALEAEPTLLEYAADRQVVLATPTTLIALLRTVAYAWTQQALADKAREIHELGRELHDRLGHDGRPPRPARPLADRSGRAPTTGPSARWRPGCWCRRGGSATSSVAEHELEAPAPVAETTRPLTAAELLEAVAEPRPELPAAAGDRDVEPRRTA